VPDGEINSASALTIMQVAARNKKLFMQIAPLRRAAARNCNRYTFHVDIPSTVMVNAVGKALVRDNMMKGKKFYTLTADYLFGHDLRGAATRSLPPMAAGARDELVATDVTTSPLSAQHKAANRHRLLQLAGNQSRP